MRGAFRIATLRGIPIRVHYSLLLVLPLLAVMMSGQFASEAGTGGVPAERVLGVPLLWGLGLAVALFFSVLLHELAHSFYARRKGGEVSDITLFIIGGVSRITRMPEGSRHEALMALAGPATSLGLGALLLAASVPLKHTPSAALYEAVASLGGLNIILGLFNLLPAFPMDGGRILRALLSGRLGHVRATQVAGTIGKSFALLFLLYALRGVFAGLFGFPGPSQGINPVLVIIALFVYLGADSESRQVLMQSLLNRVRVRELMVARTAAVDARDSLVDVAMRMRAEQRRTLPVVEDGRVVGLVTLATVRQVPPFQRLRVRAREAAQPVPPLTPESTAWEALKEMGLRRLTQLPVMQDGALVGTITQDDLMRRLELRDLEDPPLHGPWNLGPPGRESPT